MNDFEQAARIVASGLICAKDCAEHVEAEQALTARYLAEQDQHAAAHRDHHATLLGEASDLMHAERHGSEVFKLQPLPEIPPEKQWVVDRWPYLAWIARDPETARCLRSKQKWLRNELPDVSAAAWAELLA